MSPRRTRPAEFGLYQPAFEKDACGVGFVCDIKGRASRAIMVDAEHMNCCMVHRGGLGFEQNTGDGAGILTAVPHRFFERVVRENSSTTLPERGHYGVGIVFLPQLETERDSCKEIFADAVTTAGQELIGWRTLPIQPDEANIGNAARKAMPHMAQVFIRGTKDVSEDDLERKLYLIRKFSTHRIKSRPEIDSDGLFFVCSLSTKVIVYKGMLTPHQLFSFFPDLQSTDYISHLAMVHSRFSTNTFPSWDRAQPNRFMSHNGEINTLLGNKNWMNARQGMVETDLFGEDLTKLFPIVEPDCSDSGTFDNVLEFLLMTGRTLQEAVLMMIPEAWQHHQEMDPAKRAFYEYNSCLMEPWDGPASIVFTDGTYIGAVLDRNGLRPSRYYITDDDRCIMASEVGVIDVAPEKVVKKGRLQPGKIFLIDFNEGRMVPDAEIKAEWAHQRPWQQWLDRQRICLEDIPQPEEISGLEETTLMPRMQSFGYTVETMQFMLLPMVSELRDPLGSMGNDAALAVMSDIPRLLYDYFKQLYAQVTNPAIDSIREEVIMALECYVGPERNLLEVQEEHAHRLLLKHPILTNGELAALKGIDHRGWKSRTIDTTFARDSAASGLIGTLDRISLEAEEAIDEGYRLIVLSDRAASYDRIAMSTLLAVGTVHHHLVKKHLRTRIGIILESGEAREVHHHALLIGFGTDGINPYLAFEALWDVRRNHRMDDIEHVESDVDVEVAYKKAVAKGLLKIMAKMGISTLQSYKGAQIFEAVGLSNEVVERCFTGTASRIEGVGFDVLSEEMQRRHEIGYPAHESNLIPTLTNPGEFHWRFGGERHMWDPEAISDLQLAAKSNSVDAYAKFARHVNTSNTRNANLRGLLTFCSTEEQSIQLEDVEPESEIVKRFATGAMSFGSISAEAHESLAIAMNRIGGKSNTGEGGEDARRFIPLSNGDSKRSAIKQVASGRFGVTIDYLVNADQLQIKIVQGAKPGEGGELPGGKVDDYIAGLRHSIPGVGLISPPPHHDIYSIEDIAQLIHDLKNANPNAQISVKLGAEVGVGTVAAGVTKARADHLVIAGDTGGTGASPLTSIKHAGVPWELGLAETHQTLVLNNLRSRVVLQVDGQLKTGRDVAIAICLGAEEFGFSTAPLIAMGCIMMRKCHLNTCPVGIATQDPLLRAKFTGHPEHVINYMFMLASELREIMARLGFRTVNEMIGRTDVLEMDKTNSHWKSKEVDLNRVLAQARQPDDCLGVYQIHDQDHGLDNAIDHELIKTAEPALSKKKRVRAAFRIGNHNRVVGGMLSHEIIKRVGPAMLPDDLIHFKFNGSAGQSFGAWLAQGVTLEVEGDANDYVGKGLSGGRLIIYPPHASRFNAHEQILIGNVVLYGATSGECYFRGIAAERFAVRNSGAVAVVEGVGDHGCEYMTGGRVVVLGPTGRNFAAGMSGGIAYIWDPNSEFHRFCNHDLVDLEDVVERDDVDELKQLIDKHAIYTGSLVAKTLLDNWQEARRQFIKVIPIDYKQVLMNQREEQALNLDAVSSLD